MKFMSFHAPVCALVTDKDGFNASFVTLGRDHGMMAVVADPKRGQMATCLLDEEAIKGLVDMFNQWLAQPMVPVAVDNDVTPKGDCKHNTTERLDADEILRVVERHQHLADVPTEQLSNTKVEVK